MPADSSEGCNLMDNFILYQFPSALTLVYVHLEWLSACRVIGISSSPKVSPITYLLLCQTCRCPPALRRWSASKLNSIMKCILLLVHAGAEYSCNMKFVYCAGVKCSVP
jgi:hypothetical protein